MSDIAIRVEHLGKRYRIGQYVGSGAQYKTLHESLTNAVTTPLRRLKYISQSAFRDSHSSNSHSAIRHSKSSPFLWALRDVSFEVKRGEVLGIIGRNGAGKSTLLKILTRITEPTEGRVEMHGRVGSLLEVGTGFHPELTGRENVYLSGAILGMARKEIDRKFDEIVDFSGVEKYIDTPVKRYSSGMRVRLGFAVAAHLEPEILLIDEVLAVGDAQFQKKCLGKMGDVAKEGRTVLFVSHNMASVESLCSRALFLSAGTVVEDGRPDEVISLYLSQDVVDAVSVNLTAHPGRRPNMKPVLTNVSMMKADASSATTFQTGEDIIFEISLDPNNDNYDNPRLSISVFNHVGILVCKLASWAQSQCQWKLRSPQKVRCTWPDCRLAPGRYFISVGFGNRMQVIDYVEHVAVLNISQRDLYGTGKIGSGLFLPDVEWSIV